MTSHLRPSNPYPTTTRPKSPFPRHPRPWTRVDTPPSSRKEHPLDPFSCRLGTHFVPTLGGPPVRRVRSGSSVGSPRTGPCVTLERRRTGPGPYPYVHLRDTPPLDGHGDTCSKSLDCVRTTPQPFSRPVPHDGRVGVHRGSPYLLRSTRVSVPNPSPGVPLPLSAPRR